MSNVRFTNKINDGTTSYTAVSLYDQRTLGRVTNIRPGVWMARANHGGMVGVEYATRAEAGQALLAYHQELSVL